MSSKSESVYGPVLIEEEKLPPSTFSVSFPANCSCQHEGRFANMPCNCPYGVLNLDRVSFDRA